MSHPEQYHFTKMRNLVGNRKFKRVLDVGCGTGYLASFFRDCSENILAIDKKKSDIENAKLMYHHITFEERDLENYNFSGKYDLVIFSDVIYYLTSATQDRIMCEINNVLEEEGILLTSRHMGREDQEISCYPQLFERIETELVKNIDTPSYWQISLWKKTKSAPSSIIIPFGGELRPTEEVYNKIKELINKQYSDLDVISSLLWRALNDREAIMAFLRYKLGQNNSTYTLDVMALLWLLNLEKAHPSVWQKFQCSFHHAHKGGAETDFRTEFFLNWMGEQKVVLDVGIHNGVHTNLFAETNAVIGIDFPEIIAKFREKYNFETKGINVEKEGLKLFQDKTFDVVVAGEFLEHLQNPRFFLGEATRVLTPNGVLIGSCPYKTVGWEDPLHCNSVDEEKLKEWFDGLFDIEEIKIITEKGTILFLARKGGK